MYNNKVKAQCEYCGHAQVCAVKDQFIAAQAMVGKCAVPIGEKSIKYLENFEWIKPVELGCIHFTEKTPAFTEREASE